MIRPLLFYCFVDFGVEHDAPKCWVVPSQVVASTIKRSYDTWLSTPGQGGKAHAATEMRRLLPDHKQAELPDRTSGWMNAYRDAWHLIGSPISD